MAFATVDDLVARWRRLDDEESARASTLLADAAAIIEAEGVDASEPDEATAALLKMVSCEMVKRAMQASPAQPAATQGSVTVGPFSESFTYANPTGDLYLTKAEKRRLGIGGCRIGSIPPACKAGGIL